MTKKTWVDVSHIMGWSGRLTGIERVEYNLIKHYYQHTDAGFIEWDHTSKGFVPVERKQIKSIILDRNSAQETSAETAVLAKKSKLRNILGKTKKPKKPEKLDINNGIVVVLAGLWDKQSYIDAVVKISNTNDLVHIVYDLIPIVQKAFVLDFLPPIFENYMLAILPKCELIMSISDSTSRDVGEFLTAKKVKKPPIVTFHLGDEVIRAEQSQRPQSLPNVPFALSVGTIESRKNHTLLYYAYKELMQRGVTPPLLIIAGKRGWNTSDFQYLLDNDKSISSSIKILDTMSDTQLKWLYENALFTITPSFYEGWGLPVAESLNYGKVTLSSNTSSMTEAGSDFADYFSPYSTDALCNLVEKYLDSSTRNTKMAKIKKGHVPLSWQDSSRIFESAINKHIGND